MQIKYENKENVKNNGIVADYPVGTIVKYAIDNDRFDADQYIGVVLETTEGKRVLYDIEDNCIYDDVENYNVVEVLDGYFTVRN